MTPTFTSPHGLIQGDGGAQLEGGTSELHEGVSGQQEAARAHRVPGAKGKTEGTRARSSIYIQPGVSCVDA